MRRLRCNDRGSVLVLTVGLVPIAAGLVSVGTDISVLLAHRRALAAELDSAVLAAAQSADLDRLYTGQGIDSLPLDCGRARRVVESRLASESSDERINVVRLSSFSCRGGRVAASATATVRLPFAHHFGVNPQANVAAEAAARSPFRG